MRKGGKRGPGLYPKMAVKQAERVARAAGLEPESIEITRTKDGTTTIKVIGKRAGDGAAEAELLRKL